MVHQVCINNSKNSFWNLNALILYINALYCKQQHGHFPTNERNSNGFGITSVTDEYYHLLCKQFLYFEFEHYTLVLDFVISVHLFLCSVSVAD